MTEHKKQDSEARDDAPAIPTGDILHVCFPCKRQVFAPIGTVCTQCDGAMEPCVNPTDGATYIEVANAVQE